MIQCKSACDPAAPEDGRRILVDRQWPQDCPKAPVPFDAWLPDVAPSTELHQALMAGQLDFARFTAAYRRELTAQPVHWWALLQYSQTEMLTLVFTANDPLRNHAVVLAQWLEEELDRYQSSSSPVCYRDEFPEY
ncbi:DUF488 family protein [Pseudomonas sp. PCH199]|uniref:DUF488 domain-containing protein n=1 Tax=unclassified Pseudomonas TaxID=196821 RepID=UPI000BCE236C|nr:MULTISPECIES: DUF488 family protein [unclassified Pseudomonas]MCW8278500.1 DUF488 family protein [Pseudomonas sp. PCH199]PAM81288.1 MarR family transcriptional regulator [Pseudomonas sp. ERMR1:02]